MAVNERQATLSTPEDVLRELLSAGCDPSLSNGKLRLGNTANASRSLIKTMKDCTPAIETILAENEDLRSRLVKGINILFDMEQRGETDSSDYDRYYNRFIFLLDAYEARCEKGLIP